MKFKIDLKIFIFLISKADENRSGKNMTTGRGQPGQAEKQD